MLDPLHRRALPIRARARIVLAEKGLDYDAVEIDLADRPAWLYEKNRPAACRSTRRTLGPAGVARDHGVPRGALPGAAALARPILPSARSARLWLVPPRRRLGGAYYARGARTGADELDAGLAKLDAALAAQPYLGGRDYGLADIAYVPWVLRALDSSAWSSAPRSPSGSGACSSGLRSPAERELVAAL